MPDFFEDERPVRYDRVRRGGMRWGRGPMSSYASTIVLNQLKTLEAELVDLKQFRKQIPKVKGNEHTRGVLKTLINSMKEEIKWRQEFLGLEIENGNYP